MTTEVIMSSLERLVYNWLTERGIIFDFQSSLIGGRVEFGGAVVDFVLIEEGVILRIHGEYWHTGIIQEAKDREQRTMLENIGYRVVDLQEQDLTTNLDAVMNKAIMGDEMSEIDSALVRGNQGMAAGMITGLGNPTAAIPSSHTTPIVRTDEATSVSETVTLNGTLVYDGGIECDCRFRWGSATTSDDTLCWIFPFTRNRAYYELTPNIPITLGIGGNYDTLTEWLRNKRTDDTFDADLQGLTLGAAYCYRAETRNPTYTAFGGDIKFIGA